jgi:hypothetical protein
MGQILWQVFDAQENEARTGRALSGTRNWSQQIYNSPENLVISISAEVLQEQLEHS